MEKLLKIVSNPCVGDKYEIAQKNLKIIKQCANNDKELRSLLKTTNIETLKYMYFQIQEDNHPDSVNFYIVNWKKDTFINSIIRECLTCSNDNEQEKEECLTCTEEKGDNNPQLRLLTKKITEHVSNFLDSAEKKRQEQERQSRQNTTALYGEQLFFPFYQPSKSEQLKFAF